jgi:acylphosphatase
MTGDDISIPRIASRLLQSRGCKWNVRASHMAPETLAKRFYVSGTVQGVGFRFFAERVAARLNVSGYVKNLFDGRVEVYAIGSHTQLDALRSELEHGPRMSRVNRVDEADAELVHEYANGFTIERDD